jgi:hypothetical protein
VEVRAGVLRAVSATSLARRNYWGRRRDDETGVIAVMLFMPGQYPEPPYPAVTRQTTTTTSQLGITLACVYRSLGNRGPRKPDNALLFGAGDRGSSISHIHTPSLSLGRRRRIIILDINNPVRCNRQSARLHDRRTNCRRLLLWPAVSKAKPPPEEAGIQPYDDLELPINRNVALLATRFRRPPPPPPSCASRPRDANRRLTERAPSSPSLD